MEIYSVYRFTTGIIESDGTVWLTDRVPFTFVERPDTIRHVVSQGDTLWSIAACYYRAVSYAAELWPIIADFQPSPDGQSAEPIHDPTISLEAGRIIHVPSLRVIFEEILAERRQDDHA